MARKDYVCCDSCLDAMFEGNVIYRDENGNIFCSEKCAQDYYMPPIAVDRLTFELIDMHGNQEIPGTGEG